MHQNLANIAEKIIPVSKLIYLQRLNATLNTIAGHALLNDQNELAEFIIG